jgi:hypothetical protein
MRAMRGVATPALASAFAVCALAGGAFAATRAVEEAPPAELRGCGSRGEGNKPQRLPAEAGVRLGPLLLWPSIRRPQIGPGNGSAWPFVQKAPVVLPAGSAVVLAIAPGAEGLAAFQHNGRYVTAVRFKACPARTRAFAYDGTVGAYTGFPFAIATTARSACVPMEAWLVGRETPIRRVVPVGRAAC